MGLASRICCSLFSLRAAHTMGKTSTHRWDAMLGSSPATSRMALTRERTLVLPAQERYLTFVIACMHAPWSCLRRRGCACRSPLHACMYALSSHCNMLCCQACLLLLLQARQQALCALDGPMQRSLRCQPTSKRCVKRPMQQTRRIPSPFCCAVCAGLMQRIWGMPQLTLLLQEGNVLGHQRLRAGRDGEGRRVWFYRLGLNLGLCCQACRLLLLCSHLHLQPSRCACLRWGVHIHGLHHIIGCLTRVLLWTLRSNSACMPACMLCSRCQARL